MYRGGSYYTGSGYKMAVYKSSNKGVSWGTVRYLGTAIYADSRCTDIAVAPSNGSIVYALGIENRGPRIYRSSDGGSNWSDVTGNLRDFHSGTSHYGYAVHVAANAPDVVIVGTSLGAFISTNGGSSWSATMLSQPVKAFAADPRQEMLFAATLYQGVYVTIDGGYSWEKMNNGLSSLNCIDIECDPMNRLLFVGTSGGGVFRVSTEMIPTPTMTPQNTPTPQTSGVAGGWRDYD